ncbi:MAG TPA: hypothetical protein IAB27_03730 [Candidatus Coprosoma intestinipullorum]|uniref:Uncharacterized protein n=1 Tax=Candidatus Coprosoma intestinipullorum TaxID=2840752 RepID=A0A9D1CZ16_9FIRM|nr:hypothetical protein [Candidatus Coprosoma intestinipullorum]
MSAKEMFEKLGYKQEIHIAYILYIKNEDDYSQDEQRIFFHHDTETINKPFTGGINAKELQAINKQVEELGWLDE